MKRMAWVVAVLGACALSACGDDDASGTVGGEGNTIVVANWLDGTLSFVDIDALTSDVTERADAENASMDLSEHAPGPFEIEITPDGKLALVAISSGFFSLGAGFIVNEPMISQEPGSLLFIDMETRAVVGELETGEHPMGIRISKDGARAYVAHFGSGDIAIVDIAARSVIERVNIGIYAEEIAFDDTETVGVVSYSNDGSVRTFAVDDIAGTLSDQVMLEGDSAGIAFFPGTKIAFVFQAANGILALKSGYTLVDVTEPSAPSVMQDVRWDETVRGYAITAHYERNSMIVPVTDAGRLKLREYTLEGDDIALVGTTDVTNAMLMGARAVTVDGQGRVLCAIPRERVLSVSDLDSGSSFVVPWAERAGPADVAVW